MAVLATLEGTRKAAQGHPIADNVEKVANLVVTSLSKGYFDKALETVLL